MSAPTESARARAASVSVAASLAAGFHAVAHLPEGADEHAVVAAARERGVGLYGMSACRAGREPLPARLVLGFGNVGERAFTEGIAAVGDLLNRPALTSST